MRRPRTGTGSWSMHAYGLAVDVNPGENPYVGCGQSMDPSLRRYRVRTHHYQGMVGRRVVRAFGSIGWGWGGSWAGDTKDYMHFSSTGHSALPGRRGERGPAPQSIRIPRGCVASSRKARIGVEPLSGPGLLAAGPASTFTLLPMRPARASFASPSLNARLPRNTLGFRSL